jgi:hypothetical protein
MSNILELTLPFSGKSAIIRRPTGKDMVDAEVLTGSAEIKPMAYQLALTSRITLIEGRVLPYEDLLEMDAEDLTFLGKQNFSREPPPSPQTDS